MTRQDSVLLALLASFALSALSYLVAGVCFAVNRRKRT